MSTIIIINIVVNRINVEWAKYTSFVIGMPAGVYLSIKAIQNMLISPKHIYSILLTVNTVLNYPYRRKRK